MYFRSWKRNDIIVEAKKKPAADTDNEIMGECC